MAGRYAHTSHGDRSCRLLGAMLGQWDVNTASPAADGADKRHRNFRTIDNPESLGVIQAANRVRIQRGLLSCIGVPMRTLSFGIAGEIRVLGPWCTFKKELEAISLVLNKQQNITKLDAYYFTRAKVQHVPFLSRKVLYSLCSLP